MKRAIKLETSKLKKKNRIKQVYKHQEIIHFKGRIIYNKMMTLKIIFSSKMISSHREIDNSLILSIQVLQRHNLILL
jgi:hypothetical protein